MKKSELSPEQLKDRNRFVELLKKAHWLETEVSIEFDNDEWCEYEAEMEYNNGRTELTIRFHAETRSLYFIVYEKWGDGFYFIIYYENQLTAILEVLQSCQNLINTSHYKIYIDQLIDLGLKVCLDQEDSELV